MKVYVVLQYWGYDGGNEIVGVFTTRAQAECVASEIGDTGNDVEIQEEEVISS